MAEAASDSDEILSLTHRDGQWMVMFCGLDLSKVQPVALFIPARVVHSLRCWYRMNPIPSSFRGVEPENQPLLYFLPTPDRDVKTNPVFALQAFNPCRDTYSHLKRSHTRACKQHSWLQEY
jgi:hypothetical protein